jgi:integrase
VLIKPDPAGRHPYWRARYDDPDSGKRVKVRIDPVLHSTADARRDWAIKKTRALSKRRDEIANGAPRATGESFTEAVDDYFAKHPHLRPGTRRGYRDTADKLVAWAAEVGVLKCDDVTRAKLHAFRDTLIIQPKRVAVSRGKRGQGRTTGKPRSPHTINSELRAVRTVLGYLVELDKLLKVTHDDLRRATKRLDAPDEPVEYLRPHDLQKLLDAAMRHDAETYEETRDEHAGRGKRGTTLCYAPIAPFIAAVLLTGMRVGEVLALQWSKVDLEALDHDGVVVGEIRLKGADTKTRRPRTIGLEVSPALRLLLGALHLKNQSRGSSAETGRVFGLTRGTADAARKRLIVEYGAPKAFGWQILRQTCGTYLTNAYGIFGAASAYRSAKQLGHSVTIAEKHYVDLARGIPREARTLEAAMQIEGHLARLLAQVSTATEAKPALRRIGKVAH